MSTGSSRSVGYGSSRFVGYGSTGSLGYGGTRSVGYGRHCSTLSLQRTYWSKCLSLFATKVDTYMEAFCMEYNDGAKKKSKPYPHAAMRNGARKRANRVSGTRNPSLSADEYHSSQVPCCELVRDVIADVLPEALESVDVNKCNPVQSAKCTIAHSLFGSLLRTHFLERNQQNQEQQRTGEAITTAKKRNRKKKKRISDKPLPQHVDEQESRDPSIADKCKDPRVRAPQLAQESKHFKLVTEWTDRIIAQVPMSTVAEIQHHNLASFLDYIVGVNPAISIDEIGEHVLRIACNTCRTHAEAYWRSTGIPTHEPKCFSGNGENMTNRNMYLHPNMIFLSGGNLHIAGNQDEVYERAFDYVPLEEGYGATEEFHEGSWLLESTIDQATTKPSQLVMQHPMDLSTLERLTRDLILPCGLPQLDNQDSYILTDLEYCAILKQFSDMKGPIVSMLHEIDVANNDIKTVFHEILSMLNHNMSEDIATTKLDVVLSKRITTIDEQCDSFLSKWFNLLLLITEYNNNNNAEWVGSKIDRFWTAYIQGTNCIVQEIFAHEERLVRNAGSCGRILIAAVCPSHRHSLLRLLETKIRAILSIHDQIFPSIACECDEGGSFLKHLLINYSFSYVTTNEITSGKSGRDDMCEKLLVAYNESSVTKANGLNVEGMLDIQEARTKKVSFCLTEANSKLEEASIIILGTPILEKDMVQWKALQERYEEILSDLKSFENSEDKENGKDTCMVGLTEQGEQIGCFVKITIMKWRFIRRLQKTLRPTFRSTLPLCLTKWIETEGQGQIKPSDDQVCSGNEGKRRLVCIIAALYYQWMVARCKEWHAELMQKELLNDSSLASDINSKDPKVRPSSAKNKKKKGSLSVPLSTYETFEDRNIKTTIPILIQSKRNGKTRKGKGLENGAGDACKDVLEIESWVSPTGSSSSLQLKSIHPEVSEIANIVPQPCVVGDVNNYVSMNKKEYEKDKTSSVSVTNKVDAPSVQNCSKHNNTSMFQPLDNFGNIIPVMQNKDSLSENEVDATSVNHHSTIIKSSQIQCLHNFDENCTVTKKTFPDNLSYKQDDVEIEIVQVGVTTRYGFELAEDYLNSRYESILKIRESMAKCKVIII